ELEVQLTAALLGAGEHELCLLRGDLEWVERLAGQRVRAGGRDSRQGERTHGDPREHGSPRSPRAGGHGVDRLGFALQRGPPRRLLGLRHGSGADPLLLNRGEEQPAQVGAELRIWFGPRGLAETPGEAHELTRLLVEVGATAVPAPASGLVKEYSEPLGPSPAQGRHAHRLSSRQLGARYS